jgi:glycosyltransferase involved in cell wall biosynthesis
MSQSSLASELILVDNGSTDSTPSTIETISAENHMVHSVRENRAGLGFARNAGIFAARGQALLFTDDDVHVPTDWIEHLAVPLLNGDADGVMGPVQAPPWLQTSALSRAVLDLVAYCPTVEECPERLLGANMGIARSVFKTLSFDQCLGSPGYPGWEDMLLSWQMREAGMILSGVQSARVVHHFDPKRLQKQFLIRQVRGYGKGDAYVRHHWHHDDQALRFLRRTKAWLEVVGSRLRKTASLDRRLDAEWQYAMHCELFRQRDQLPKYIRT